MSATLDTDALARSLQATVLTAEGRCYSVVTRYRERPLQKFLEQDVAQDVLRVLRSETGSVLVFLPGASEIRRTRALLSDGAPAD